MRISISSFQYRVSKGILILLEMTPSLLDEIESAISNPLLPVANWATMLLAQDLLSQQVAVRDDAAEGLQITGTGKFLLLLSELTLLRYRDNSPVFASAFSPIVVQVTEKDLQAGTFNIHLPPQKLLRIKALNRDGMPVVNKTVCYQNIRDVPTAFYSVKTDGNGEVVLCGVREGAYIVAIPKERECEYDRVHVVVEDSDLDDQEIILQPRRGS